MEQVGSKLVITDLDAIPPGYRFKPKDHELILHYLKPKVYQQPLMHKIINEVQLYNYNPDTLAETYRKKYDRVSELYFFTPRDRKYRNGSRPSRSAGNGFWKATGKDQPVNYGKTIVGSKKTLVFYKGKPPKGNQKTNWIMHEFVLKDSPQRERTSTDDMRLNDWVLCRIYNRKEDISSKEEEDSFSDTISTSMPDTIPNEEQGNFREREVNPDMMLSGYGNYTPSFQAPPPQTTHIDIGQESAMFPQPLSMLVPPNEEMFSSSNAAMPPISQSSTAMQQFPNDQFTATYDQSQQSLANQFTVEDGYLLDVDFDLWNHEDNM